MEMRAFRFSVFIVALFTAGFVAGVARTRQVMINAAEDVASRPVNTFSKCLTEGWEQTGELGEWRGKRKWVLTEDRQ